MSVVALISNAPLESRMERDVLRDDDDDDRVIERCRYKCISKERE